MKITCAPYPAIATDLSPILASALARYGSGSLRDTVFPMRRSFLAPLYDLGARYTEREDGEIAFHLPDPIRQSTVEVPDLRTGAGLLLYALSLPVPVSIDDKNQYILRGYEDLTKKINALGANVSVDTL